MKTAPDRGPFFCGEMRWATELLLEFIVLFPKEKCERYTLGLVLANSIDNTFYGS